MGIVWLFELKGIFMKVENATPKAFSPHRDNIKVSMHFVMIQAKSGSTDIPSG